MNFGTPQEVIDDIRDNEPNEQGGCISLLVFIVFMFLIIYLLN